jgi:uncharacterized iron-regulated protein
MNNKIFNLVFLFIFCSLFVYGQKAEAYKIYSNNGKKSNFKKLAKATEKADIVLFGEFHNNPVSHWLKYELIDNLINNKEIILGSEIFEADDQIHLSAYIDKRINKEEFDSLARLWPNYQTDYSAIVNLARKNSLIFVATNIPRKYANMVFHNGFEILDSLSEKEKAFIAPLPIDYDPELPGYKKMLSMGMMMKNKTSENFPKAQAIKDATMAYFINKNYEEGKTFFHFNGSFHSNNYEGILWYLKRLNPGLNYLTISTVTQKNVFKLAEDHKNIADFILVVSDNMTTSY